MKDLKGVAKIKRIHELKKQKSIIMDNIKRWDAMDAHDKASSWYYNDILRYYHELDDINKMLSYAKKGYNITVRRLHFYDIIH